MGKATYIADDLWAVSLQGLRWVRKIDERPFGSGDERHALEVQYKGATQAVRYDSREARDAMYQRIVEALARTAGGG